MPTRRGRPKDVAAYIAAAPAEARAHLRRLRALVRAAAPGAKEELKWGMPAYTRGRILVMFAGFKRHAGFFPTPSAMKAFKRELKAYRTGAGSVQFPYEKPLPLALIRRMVAFRLRELEERDAKWMG